MLPLETLEELLEANRRLRQEIELLRADIKALHDLTDKLNRPKKVDLYSDRH